MSLTPGTRLGPYEVLEALGAGLLVQDDDDEDDLDDDEDDGRKDEDEEEDGYPYTWDDRPPGWSD